MLQIIHLTNLHIDPFIQKTNIITHNLIYYF
jgi:hypothetical protein